MPVVIASGVSPINHAVVLWDNKANISNISGSSTAAGFPAVNAVDVNTWSSWKPSAAPSAIMIDYGAATSVNSVGVAAHNLFSSGVTDLRVEHSDNGTNWTLVHNFTPPSNDDLLIIIPQSSHRYWRINIIGAVANIGYLSFGTRLNFPHSPIDDYVPLNHARQYTKLRNDSLKGQWLGNRVIAAGAETEIDMGYVTRSWADTNLPAFKSHYDQGGTFFWASCPSKYPLDMGYCQAAGDDETMAITYVEADKMSTVSFGVKSYVAQ